jgi:hypothetical protein
MKAIYLAAMAFALLACDVTVERSSQRSSSSRRSTTTVAATAPAAPTIRKQCVLDLPDGWVRQTVSAGGEGTDTYINASLPMSLTVRCDEMAVPVADAAYAKFKAEALATAESAPWHEQAEGTTDTDGERTLQFDVTFPIEDDLLVRHSTLRVSGVDRMAVVYAQADLVASLVADHEPVFDDIIRSVTVR